MQLINAFKPDRFCFCSFLAEVLQGNDAKGFSSQAPIDYILGLNSPSKGWTKADQNDVPASQKKGDALARALLASFKANPLESNKDAVVKMLGHNCFTNPF